MRFYKAAVPIRTLLITVFIMSIFTYSAFLFFGGISIDNSVTVSNTLYAQYVNVSNNQSQPTHGSLSYIASLNKLSGGQQNATSNPNSAFGLSSSVGLAAGYFGALGNIYNNLITVISTALQLVGIPTQFSVVVANIALVMIVFIAILSAIFLFPI